MSTMDPAAPSFLLSKVRALGSRHERLREETQRAQSAEALSRARLTEALVKALAARESARALARAAITARHAAMWASRPGRRGRPRRAAERVLAQLGSWGRERIIAWSGVGPEGAAFDGQWYGQAYPDVFASGCDPFIHYLTRGGREDRSPHPFFDGRFYARQAGLDLASSGLTALEHYCRIGAGRGFSPHPLFDTAYYLTQAPEVAATGANPWIHFLQIGAAADLSPHVLFQANYYRGQAAAFGTIENPLLHYLAVGSALGLKPHPLFDPKWYRARYELAVQVEPLAHFVQRGGLESLDPGPWFDGARFQALRGDARPATLDPLSDYLSGGAWVVAEPVLGFQTFAYLATAPELAETGLTPLEHWAARSDPERG